FQAEDGIRDFHVTGVQTCALPILMGVSPRPPEEAPAFRPGRNPDLLLRHPARPGHKRREEHPRRRAGGEVKRLWSWCKTSTRVRSEERRVGKEFRSQEEPLRETRE